MVYLPGNIEKEADPKKYSGAGFKKIRSVCIHKSITNGLPCLCFTDSAFRGLAFPKTIEALRISYRKSPKSFLDKYYSGFTFKKKRNEFCLLFPK